MNREEACRLLEVPFNCSEEQVKRAFRLKAKQCHPDRGGSSENFRLIKEAYELLKSRMVCVNGVFPLMHSQDSIFHIKRRV